MALTALQRRICQLLAARRRSRGESYVAGGVALGEALRTARLSRDVDIFHDSEEAVARSWDDDRTELQAAGFGVTIVRERPGFVEAVVRDATGEVVIEWARDSAFRFFPLVESEILGLTLHPFDLAANKVLALVGRLEARDWVDVLACDARLQPLGYLAWAACGKDPGFTPAGILDHASRSARYTEVELASLAFEGERPSASDLGRRWHEALDAARAVIAALPPAHAGSAVLTPEGDVYRRNVHDLAGDLRAGVVTFHTGRIGGAWPRIKS